MTIGIAMTSGCSFSDGVRDSSTLRGSSSSPVVSPLSVSIPQGSRIASVNSVALSAVELRLDDPKGSGLDSEAFTTTLNEVASRVLNLKVYSTEWLKKQGAQPALVTLKNSGVDAVLTTEILQFGERHGSAVGGEPATVAYRMNVFSTIDGSSVWSGTYFHKQQPLSDNLLKIGEAFGKGGAAGGWSSAEEELRRGFEAGLRDFGSRRDVQFFAKRPN